jgi:MFS transporter, FHS family, L-fucose permease
MIIMAIIGGAVFTPIMGLIAKHGMDLAMCVPVVCYIYICFYSFIGSKPGGPLYTGESTSVKISH